MFGTLTNNEIEKLLKKQSIGRLGCHATGKTYVVPTSFAYDGKFIYCHAFEGMKINMMRENPSVCFEVDNLENVTEWKSVIAWGRFEEIKDDKQKADAIKKIMKSTASSFGSKSIKTAMGAFYPFHSKDLKKIEGIVFRIFLEEKSGRFESNEKAYE